MFGWLEYLVDLWHRRFGLVVGILMVVSFFLLSAFLLHVTEGISGWGPSNVTAVRCCGGQGCTDTYYDEATGLCHLTQCEQLQRAHLVGLDTSRLVCTYRGAAPPPFKKGGLRRRRTP